MFEPWIERVLWGIFRLLIVVSAGCFIGSVFEYRNWMSGASFLVRPLMKWGRLPSVSGGAFLTAIASNNAANSIIAGAYADGKITRKEMILSGIANSYPAKVSHSLRILFPVAAALGLPALIYFALQFFCGFLRTFIIFWIGRSKDIERSSENLEIPEKKVIPWPETFRKSFKRTGKLLLRVLLITAPMYLLVAWMYRSGFFNSWKEFMPETFSRFFPPELMTVVAARLGGLVSAAGIAFEMKHAGDLNSAQILIAFFAGNIITNPIRTLRRNLPSALGIFPKSDGLWIVLILQSFRLLFAIIVIVILFLLFN
jgi:hypothetical protein